MLQTFPKALCSRVLSYELPKPFDILWASLVAQMVKKLPAKQETWDRKIPARRELQPTPVFLPGESQGQRTLADCSPWSHRVRYDQATNTTTKFKMGTLLIKGVSKDVSFMSDANLIPPRIYFKFVLDGKFLC